MKLLLRPNFQRKNVHETTRNIVNRLLELGAEPMLELFHKKVLDIPQCTYDSLDNLLDQCDVIVPVGGDGTVLNSAQCAIKANKPIMGINGGRVGFLTELEGSELEYLSLLVKGEYKISKRMLLEAVLETSGKEHVMTAMNDIVVRREDTNRILDISVFLQEKLVMRQLSDGLIFATPTGSTAYSLSAGGAVVTPDIEVLLLTAICPHTVFRCPLVLSPDQTYTVRSTQNSEETGFSVSVDGQYIGHVDYRDRLRVRKSSAHVSLVELGLRDFYGNLNDKLQVRR